MKAFLCILTIFCSLFLMTTAWAHGDASHVIGTVTAVDNDHVVVETPKGETLSIAWRPDTTFQRKGIHSDDARPQIGDRLVAEVTKKGLPDNRDWIATEIQFATPKKP